MQTFIQVNTRSSRNASCLPKHFLTGCHTSATMCVAIRKLKSLGLTLSSSIFVETKFRQNLAYQCFAIRVRRDGKHRQTGSSRWASSRDTVFTGEVQGEVKQSGAHGFIEISSRSVTHERVASDPRPFRNRSRFWSSANSRRESHARLTPHLPLYTLRFHVSHIHRSVCLYMCVCARVAERDAMTIEMRGPDQHICGSPTLSRLTTVMGVNGHDVSRHALEIVKADPPASDHQLARETGTSFEDERTTGPAGRTTSLTMLFFVHDAGPRYRAWLYLSFSHR